MKRRSFLELGLAGALTAGLGLAGPMGELRRKARERRISLLEAVFGGGDVPSSTSPDWERLRAAYLLDPEVVYLNHAAIGTVPRPVHEAYVAHLRACESDPALHIWGDPWNAALTEVRRMGAALLGVDEEEVALTHNTTEAFNLLAQGLPLGAGDEVLFSQLNHPGASRPWHHQAARRGFQVRSFTIPPEEIPGLRSSDLLELHLAQLSSRTRVLVLPHLDNEFGLLHPVETLARQAKARGVGWVLVDGAQVPGMLPSPVVTLQAEGVDAYATSAHKWLQAPKGLGLLAVRRAIVAEVRPFWVSSGRRDQGTTAARFEDYGTRNLPLVLALGDAIAFLASLPADQVLARRRYLAGVARDRVASESGLAWASPRRWEGGGALFRVTVPGEGSGPELALRLRQERGIALRGFGAGRTRGVRISPNLATRPDEVERAIAALVAFQGL